MAEGSGMEQELKRQIEELHNEKAALPRKYGRILPRVASTKLCFDAVKFEKLNFVFEKLPLIHIFTSQAQRRHPSRTKAQHPWALDRTHRQKRTSRSRPPRCRARAQRARMRSSFLTTTSWKVPPLHAPTFLKGPHRRPGQKPPHSLSHLRVCSKCRRRCTRSRCLRRLPPTIHRAMCRLCSHQPSRHLGRKNRHPPCRARARRRRALHIRGLRQVQLLSRLCMVTSLPRLLS
jgi:hypothetical protein